MSGQGEELYMVLGVGKDATTASIKKAYNEQALVWHPDKHTHPAMKQKATEMFKLVQEAYEVLTNPIKRRMYDNGGYTPQRGDSAAGGDSGRADGWSEQTSRALQEIRELSKANMRTRNTVAELYKRSVVVGQTVAIGYGASPLDPPILKLVEKLVPAKTIFDQHKVLDNMIRIEGPPLLMNNLNFSVNNYNDLERLNDEMPKTAENFKFMPSAPTVAILEQFKENLVRIGQQMKQVETTLYSKNISGDRKVVMDKYTELQKVQKQLISMLKVKDIEIEVANTS
ncbi:unnamed protein product [Vitrella brassicaformis CCMP3155]|uniref:J domain-containing protein n=2 Tax=Vitrella brassicaformis TaxID=1169539 RepID=A0A0G4H457_VITBC|nr:unnamed protein product [Vitrella brassicaformis CCMP3155]|mmetsp:Transcript_31734/g.78661  ORF Transcript_31734/g.78661 Transcript_31734/m.78661 type:complete len:284 (+) Transcript_31734:331-1182(+)|eukprot:CEM38538.1 unnamed protein product [Vitrella brassicaformis CCMP3155]